MRVAESRPWQEMQRHQMKSAVLATASQCSFGARAIVDNQPVRWEKRLNDPAHAEKVVELGLDDLGMEGDKPQVGHHHCQCRTHS